MSDHPLHARLDKLQEVLGKTVTFDPSRKWSTIEPEAGIRTDSSSDWQKQYLTFDKFSGTTVPSPRVADGPAREAFDDSTLGMGESLEEGVTFCPFKRIEQYPEQFIGKRNKPLAQRFFDRVSERTTWSFFHLHLPGDARQSCLLVPTTQFVDFLDEVNSELGIHLCIPKGSSNEPHFNLTFGHGGTPRPRYAGKSHENASAMMHNQQVMGEDVTAFKAASEEDQKSWLASWEGAKVPVANPRGDADHRARLSAERAERKKRERESMLGNVQARLGTAEGRHDARAATSTNPVLFVSIDIEVLEEGPHSMTEMGIAVLDTRSIRERDRGPGGILWWEHIKAHHLVVRQYASHVNYKYVQGCPDKFQFGESVFSNEWELIETLSSILTCCTRDGETDVVLVGHDIQADVRYLSTAGYDVAKALAPVDVVDTQILHQAWKGAKQARKLERILSDLCMPYSYLHNAGNDAVYTLRAMITLGVEGPMPEGQTRRRPQLAAEDVFCGAESKGNELW